MRYFEGSSPAGAVLSAVLCVLLHGCNGTPSVKETKTEPRKQAGTEAAMSHPYSPKPGDDHLTRGPVTIEEVTMASPRPSEPTVLTITGTLPTPCHELRFSILDA